MESDWNRWLRERAYALWEKDGRPDGRASDHWSQAEEEFKQKDRPADPAKGEPSSPQH